MITDLSRLCLRRRLAKISAALKSLVFGAWIALFLFIGWGMYAAYVKPHINPIPTKETTQQAEQIINQEYNYNEPDKDFFLGVKLFGFRLGLSK